MGTDAEDENDGCGRSGRGSRAGGAEGRARRRRDRRPVKPTRRATSAAWAGGAGLVGSGPAGPVGGGPRAGRADAGGRPGGDRPPSPQGPTAAGRHQGPGLRERPQAHRRGRADAGGPGDAAVFIRQGSGGSGARAKGCARRVTSNDSPSDNIARSLPQRANDSGTATACPGSLALRGIFVLGHTSTRTEGGEQ